VTKEEVTWGEEGPSSLALVPAEGTPETYKAIVQKLCETEASIVKGLLRGKTTKEAPPPLKQTPTVSRPQDIISRDTTTFHLHTPMSLLGPNEIVPTDPTKALEASLVPTMAPPIRSLVVSAGGRLQGPPAQEGPTRARHGHAGRGGAGFL